MTTPEDRDLWERDEEALRAEVRKLSATLDRASRDSITEARAYVALHEKARADAAKVARVEALHIRRRLPDHPRTGRALAVAPDRCSTCWGDGNYEVWPCPTIRALTDAPAEQRAEGGA
jgi:hypothetical protein